MAITLRSASHDSVTTKGSPLTHAELDANFTSFLDSSGSSLVGFIQSGSGAVAGTVEEKLQQVVHVDDFGAVGDGATDDSTAIQNAINTLAGTVELGPKDYYIGTTGLTLKFRQCLRGKGKRATTITYAGTGTAISTETGDSPTGYSAGDITDGAHALKALYLKLTNAAGSGFTNYTSIASSLLLDADVAIRNVASGSAAGGGVGVTLNGNTNDAGSGSYVGYWNKVLCEIRGFQVGILGKNNANDIEIDGQVIHNCTTAIELESVSGWLIKSSIETSVSNAIGIHFAKTAGKTTTNIVVMNKRFEMTAGTPEALKFGAGTVSNITLIEPRYLLNGSPSEFSGTIPTTLVQIKAGVLRAYGGIKLDGDITHAVGDADRTIIAGGSALSISNGALLILAGASHATTPGRAQISVPNSREFQVLVNSITQFQVTNGVITCVGDLRPSTPAGAAQSAAAIHAGSGAPSDSDGANGDFYFRSDGTVSGNTVVYHKEAGSWVACTTT